MKTFGIRFRLAFLIIGLMAGLVVVGCDSKQSSTTDGKRDPMGNRLRVVTKVNPGMQLIQPNQKTGGDEFHFCRANRRSPVKGVFTKATDRERRDHDEREKRRHKREREE